MTAAVPIVGKGCSVLMSITAVYTAIPALVSFDISGEESKTYESTALDGAAGETHAPTGYVAAPVISGEFFYDPTHTVHIALIALKRAPAATNFKITYTDTGPLSEIWSVVGVGVDTKVVLNDGVKSSFKLQTSGTAS